MRWKGWRKYGVAIEYIYEIPLYGTLDTKIRLAIKKHLAHKNAVNKRFSIHGDTK